MRLSVIPLLLLGLPLMEIAGFVIVGKAIGLWATLALTILTSIIGAMLLRRQGMEMLRRLSSEGRSGNMPGHDLIHGAMIVLAAILLMVPGFLTDIAGLLLFIAPIRDLIWQSIGRRVVVAGSSRQFYRAGSGSSAADARASETRRPFDPNVVDLKEEDYHRNGKDKPPSSGNGQIGN